MEKRSRQQKLMDVYLSFKQKSMALFLVYKKYFIK
ncbi:unnamed protein product [Paramecium sonneborni]|uniref:Uncharacterized protein n=1 Tax=Paramecium sonneborni TaxID=65129 RepID=A0A8S1QHV7_9CILI|nr:unnamed protein product [Paramecium sonneborni]